MAKKKILNQKLRLKKKSLKKKRNVKRKLSPLKTSQKPSPSLGKKPLERWKWHVSGLNYNSTETQKEKKRTGLKKN